MISPIALVTIPARVNGVTTDTMAPVIDAVLTVVFLVSLSTIFGLSFFLLLIAFHKYI